MEVAGQWRREWSGTAEYGKVTEGGVTRRVARAMEVLHASAPGARVRVMRAAYHSSAGPGSSSYLMHSSRKVLSSGYDFLEPSSLPSKPLEISSTPLETSPDGDFEREEYKVTEPDDYEISEPSKWRGSTRNNSIRMPSEESSSADNASIIDLDSRASSRSTSRRRSNEKEDLYKIHTINTRVSPLLDAPVALSTLKYTSILNGSDDWNSRRKSYSFEDTSPVDNISNNNNMFTKDSSTDSGICKSSEIVNDYSSNIPNSRYTNNIVKMDHIEEESFKDWLSKNRSNSYKRSISPKPRDVLTAESKVSEGKITLQSSGKVTITLPIDTYKDQETEISRSSEESDRKTKKVEFCKTELHFAVDTGTVNIIATDEKPPPSTDFRKRRSAFVPLNEKIERSITLFGEKSDALEIRNIQGISNSDFGECDENTAATKSILKNKIPKPKPYLLGENMVFGESHVSKNNSEIVNSTKCTSVISAVSLINKQFQPENEPGHKINSSFESDLISIVNKPLRTGNRGPQLHNDFNHKQSINDNTFETFSKSPCDFKTRSISATQNKPKIRELRETDLAYFGIEDNIRSKKINSQDNLQEEILHSVKLVQQISNSVCNSEAESDDTPEYQNLSKYNLPITPTPKPRSKYIDKGEIMIEPRILKPIIEQDTEKVVQTNRMRVSKTQAPLRQATRQIAEKPGLRTKSIRTNITIKNSDDILLTGINRNTSMKKLKSNKENETTRSTHVAEVDRKKSESPLYVNLNKVKAEKTTPILDSPRPKNKEEKHSLKPEFKPKAIKSVNKSHKQINSENEKSDVGKRNSKYEMRSESEHNHKKRVPRRTEKLTTPDHVTEYNVKKRSNNNITPTSKNNNKDLSDVSQNSLRKFENKNSDLVVEVTKQRKDEKKYDNLKTPQIMTKSNTNNKEYITVNQNSLRGNKGPLYSQNSLKTYQNNTEKMSITKSEKPKSKRSKYVINYDDKNGTVSSICKIKSGPGTYKRKLITVENKGAQESNTTNNNKSLNKIALRK